MDDAERTKAADVLATAYRTRVAVAPLVETYPEVTVEDAYGVQQLQVRQWLAGGAALKGHKVGLTSAAMQRQLGVAQPDYGVLRDDMFHAEYAPIPVERFLQPRVEPEIAFVLRRDLAGPGVTVAEAAAAVDFVLPALEIIDSRIRDWKIGICDTIADNASSGGVVLGATPTSLTAVDIRLSGCNLYGDGELVATGAGGAVLGSPLLSLAWLANTVGRHGVVLRAGHVVLPGSVTAAQPVRPGSTWTAQFGGIGSVTARFGAPASAGAGPGGTDESEERHG
ncbi:2-keto-4-pentenoate hydratase [Phytohabitans suffuscus]|uniref:2-keto-4-pentenoate hydratase n=1 Tax=Phytohabitans suffuscus TaxID=624315 RepID=A0A6F8YTR8_9ACTN|nr:2-keto-4-pentenoate hydratase [Phytohabitans suffuscus]BCB89504.1 2-keto-4-pentenoate hydratase [Phytohabitans suffuscus]